MKLFKSRWDSIVKLVIILVVSGIIGMLLLVAVYCLPTDKIKSNIGSGAYVYLQETSEFQYADGYVSTILDNCTDQLMLSKVAYPSTNPVLDAVRVPSYVYKDSAYDMSLLGYLNDNQHNNTGIDTYARYWHGYQVILRPLFEFLNFSDVMILNQAVQMILFVAMLLLLVKNDLSPYIPAYIVMMIFWNSATMGMSLQYSPCYYISLLASCVLLILNKQVSNMMYEKLWFCDSTIFLVTGILLAYFDFLTYPVATLGIPLVIWVLIHRDKENDKLWEVVRLSICWAVGYLGMWSEKWIIGSLISKDNIIADAIANITNRTSSHTDQEQISRIGTVVYLMKRAFVKKPYFIVIILALVVIAISVRRKPKSSVNHEQMLILILIGCIPLIWYFIAANHSYEHPRLVYRALGVLVFSWLAAFTEWKCEVHK